MTEARCLGCYGELDAASYGGYHKKCSRKLFEVEIPPGVEFGSEDLEELARQAVSRHLGITGVQPKISVDVQRMKEDPNHRLMIVGLWGDYILKPPTTRFPEMPVVEDLTMHLAEAAGLRTARHGLVRMKSGELAYVSRRFDRQKIRRSRRKVAVEDFCQLSGLLTERKYKTSTEKAGKIISNYSAVPGLDLVTFFDVALFSFITGNADMHLKNCSLMANERGEMVLSPCYDLVSTRLMPIDDIEEMALTVNGKKARLTRSDFETLGMTLKIPKKAIENSFARLLRALPEFIPLIRASFLSASSKERYEELIALRGRLLGIPT